MDGSWQLCNGTLWALRWGCNESKLTSQASEETERGARGCFQRSTQLFVVNLLGCVF